MIGVSNFVEYGGLTKLINLYCLKFLHVIFSPLSGRPAFEALSMFIVFAFCFFHVLDALHFLFLSFLFGQKTQIFEIN